MRESNKHARLWLLENGYDHIWFKRHVRKPDRFYTQDLHTVKEKGVMVQKPYYYGIDMWNLFDGICFHQQTGQMIFFQVKTNQWPQEDPFYNFKYAFHNREDLAMMFINVKLVKGRWQVLTKFL